MSRRLRVGVIGAGVIGQVMHLHFLRELKDRYDIAAICDLSLENAKLCAEEYGVTSVFTDWREMLKTPLDAVFVLTSGSHAPMAIEAARAGLHVFVEKPMCFSADEGRQMIDEAKRAGVVLMVGYPKRYDAAYGRFKEEVSRVTAPKLLRVTTTESPFSPYVRHYPLTPPPADVDASVLAVLTKDSDARLFAAIGTDDAFLLHQYQAVLLDTLVHEINTSRGVLGEPDHLDYVDMRPGQLNVALRFGDTAVAIHWVDTPAMTRYAMEFAMFADDAQVTLSFPSPYLRNAPTMLAIDRGEPDTVTSGRREEVTSYESGFKEELRVFHSAVTEGGSVPTDGTDGARDIALCQAIIRSVQSRAPVEHPTAL